MELNFDKEMDALLRQSAREGEAAASNENPQPATGNQHLDADEISAFAENALPEKIRQNYVLHLADCERCRTNLSSLILLNSETEISTVHTLKKEISASPIPWYRKLFAVPNLAYALGTLVLAFSGIAVFTVLQNDSVSKNAEVSQVSERQPNGKGMSSEGDALAPESYSSNATTSNQAVMNSNMAMSNTAAVSSNSAMPAAPVMTANSNVATVREQDKDVSPNAKTPVAETKPNEPAKRENSGSTPPPPAAVRDAEDSAESETQRQQPVQNSPVQNQTNITPDSRSVQTSPKLSSRDENKRKRVEESRNDAQEKSVETTSVAGKTFKRTNNVWYDSAYRGQATRNIVRGTNEYKKLDSGLRGIAENLGGTVVVVWKEKAYRIQ